MDKTLNQRIGVNALLLFIAAMLSVSCSSMKGAFKKVDLTKISIGMAKEEVIAALGKDPANIVAAKQFDDGVMEVLEYHDYVSPNANRREFIAPDPHHAADHTLIEEQSVSPAGHRTYNRG